MKATGVGCFAVMSYARDGVHGVQVTIEQRRGYTHDARSIKHSNTYTSMDAVYIFFQRPHDKIGVNA